MTAKVYHPTERNFKVACAERDRLKALNAELVAKLEKLARILGGGPIPGKGSAKALAAECRAVLAKAKGE